jgi:hypothetical protein
MGGRMNYFHKSFTKKKKKKSKKVTNKGREKRFDSILGQYTNACKLSAN